MIFSLFTTATLVSLAHPAHAQSTYTLLEPLPTITETGASVMGKEINLNDYINYAINLLIAISAAAAVFMIVWGGLLYMTTDSWNGKSEGKEKVTNAIIGLLMVLSTYIILKTVNPALVAIPATLVPPITGLATSSSKDFYNALMADMNQIRGNNSQAITQLKNLEATTKDLNKQLSDTEKKFSDAGCRGVDYIPGVDYLQDNTTQCNQIDAEIKAINVKIQDNAGQAIVIYANQSMDNTLLTIDPVHTPITDIYSTINKNRLQRDTALGELDAAGAYDRESDIFNKANLNEAKIAIQGQSATLLQMSGGSDYYNPSQDLKTYVNNTLANDLKTLTTFDTKDTNLQQDNAVSNIMVIQEYYLKLIDDPVLKRQLVEYGKQARAPLVR